MAHPLDDAFSRIEGAKEHLSELKRLKSQWLADKFNTALLKQELARSNKPFRLLIEIPEAEPPRRFRLVVGKAINDLRSALDYLIHALAERDTGHPVRGTQFPIEDTPDGFKRRKKTYIKGLNAAHIARIEQLQPYRGHAWTGMIRDLSNTDKHRHLIKAETTVTRAQLRRAGLAANLAMAGTPAKLITLRIPKKGTKGTTETTEMNVYVNLDFQIRLKDGTPLVEQLELLITVVEQQIGAFKTEFE